MLDDQKLFFSSMCFLEWRYFKFGLQTWHKCKNDENWQKIECLGVNISKMGCFAILLSFISKNNDVRLPKNVYQLVKFSGGISSLDSKQAQNAKSMKIGRKLNF